MRPLIPPSGSSAASLLFSCAFLCASSSACGSATTGPPRLTIDAGLADASSDSAGDAATDGFSLASSPPVGQGSLRAGQLLLTASGEPLAVGGYDFPATAPGDPVFADGWEIRFDHVLATLDKIALSTDPDRVPTDQSQVGSLVAELDGPWAVDLHQDGAGWPYVAGKETGERAVAFGVLANENKNGNQPFPTDGTRFAIGFSAVVATRQALNVNLGPAALAHYHYMVDNQCVVLYVGHATWRGDKSPGLCTGPSAPAGAGSEAEFGLIPKDLDFDLCFKPHTPLAEGAVETTYVNCVNRDNDPAAALNGEQHQRGISFASNSYVTGEVTFHTDHPFWESTSHDTPARFDPFAAQAVGVANDGGVPTVHFEQLSGIDYMAFTDSLGNTLPWRTCDPNYQNPNGGSRVGPMRFDPVSVPHCTNGDRSTGLCDYDDFSKYDQSTQGHWNGADGLCFVERAYLSPR